MSELRRKVGFISALSRQRIGSLLWPEGTLALLVGLGGGWLTLTVTIASDRRDIAGDMLAITGALLGVVFAASTFVVTLFSDSYVRLLSKSSDDGVLSFFRPFMLAIGLQVSTLSLAIGYRMVATQVADGNVSSRLEVGLFLILCFLFFFSLFDIVSLARAVTMHGYLRAEQIKSDDRVIAESEHKVITDIRKRSK